MEAAAFVVIGAILGGIVQAINAWRDRRREGRAAALVVFDTLTEIEGAAGESQLEPYSPVTIATDVFPELWDAERKALARTLPRDDFAVISKAFAEVRRLSILAKGGQDPREEVFDSVADIGRLCEKARRIAWRHSRSARERVKEARKLRERIVKERWGYFQLGRSVRRARKNGRP